jgi:hypothetical protein
LKPEIDRENHSRTSTTPLLTHTIIVTKETPSSFRTSLKVSQVLNAKQLLLSHFFLLIYYSQMQIIYMLFYFILFYFILPTIWRHCRSQKVSLSRPTQIIAFLCGRKWAVLLLMLRPMRRQMDLFSFRDNNSYCLDLFQRRKK